ncbi:MAG: signal peptide peptidase SppA [Acetobacteraceae bacterium]
MSLETDLLIDRRRLKRRLTVWRIVAVLAVVAAIMAGLRAGGGMFGASPYVARLAVDGIIGNEDRLAARVRDLADDPHAKALIVTIDSPGGSVAGGEALHDAIAAVAQKKPVVAVMGGVAASAGYMIAVPAARIFARAGTLTGSIGVYLQSVEVSGLLTRLGINAEVVKSGPLKDQPGLTEPLTPAGRQMLQGLVMNLYDQFVAMVAAGRHMDPATVRQLADGRPYTGEQALKHGLIDALGGEHAARRWLATSRGVPATLPERPVTVAESLTQRALAASLEPIVQGFWKSVLSQSVVLDGAWSLWQRSVR